MICRLVEGLEESDCDCRRDGVYMLSAKELKEKLQTLSADELISFIVKVYRSHSEIREDVEKLFEEETDVYEKYTKIIMNPTSVKPHECKEILNDYVKTVKDKKRRVEIYLSFADCVVDETFSGPVDYKLFMVASATYGKAMKIIQKNTLLWEEFREEAYQLANQFYQFDTESARQAVIYYRETKAICEH